MSRLILLDAGPLGMVTNPKSSAVTERCTRWLISMLANGAIVAIPEIADYEVRRELLRAGKQRGLARLDRLQGQLRYLPITTEVMRQAADFWAQARQRGYPTADDKDLDSDMILAAQAVSARPYFDEVIIATTNVGHLSRFVDARKWENIVLPT